MGAEELLAKVAGYATWGDALECGVFDGTDPSIMEAFWAEAVRLGAPLDLERPHPLVSTELDFWTTVMMPKDKRKDGPRHLVKPDAYGDEVPIPAAWEALVVAAAARRGDSSSLRPTSTRTASTLWAPATTRRSAHHASSEDECPCASKPTADDASSWSSCKQRR